MALVNVLLLVSVAFSALTVSLGAGIFDVIRYGAKGDGKADDTQAFLKAWQAACGNGGSSTFLVPTGKTYFLNPLVFMGPCKSSVIQVQINGYLVAPSTRVGWKNCDSNTWIVFHSVNGLKISGTGTLDAKGSCWWLPQEDSVPAYSNGVVCAKPTTFRLFECNSAQLTGVKFLNSGGNHISITNCNNLNIFNIVIKAPITSHNTDGIDIYGSSGVQISHSFIGTGDDCIAINNNCNHVNISHIQCGPGHGISVGSLGKDGSSAAVDGIFVQHCTFTNTQASARIKTWEGGSGYARNIHYDHLTLNSVDSAIEINQKYRAAGPKLLNPETNSNSNGVQVSDVHFTNVQGSGQSIQLECNPNAPCNKIFLEQVYVKPALPGKQVNVTCQHAKVISSSVTPKVQCST